MTIKTRIALVVAGVVFVFIAANLFAHCWLHGGIEYAPYSVFNGWTFLAAGIALLFGSTHPE